MEKEEKKYALWNANVDHSQTLTLEDFEKAIEPALARGGVDNIILLDIGLITPFVWEDVCSWCPSAHYPLDREAEAVLEEIRNGEDPAKYLFACGFRSHQRKICRGQWNNILKVLRYGKKR